MHEQIPSPPPLRPPLFAVGTPVRRRANTARVGVVQEAQWNPALGTWMLKVRFSQSAALSALPEFELDRLPPAGPSPSDDLRLGLVASAQAIKSLLTLERLRALPAPLGERAAPLRAAFDPESYLPLLKLLELPTPRLLLADAAETERTVALGILVRDFLVRRQARQVLLFTPRAERLHLAHCLRRELGLPVSVLDTRAFRNHLLAMKKGWELPAITAVISLESLQAPELSEMLQQYQPAIDLVVLDEADRLLPGSLEYEAALALSVASDGLILRTDAPVRTRPEDLLPLLALLEPSELAGLDPIGLVSTTQVTSRLLSCLQDAPVEEALSALEMLEAHPAFALEASPETASAAAVLRRARAHLLRLSDTSLQDEVSASSAWTGSLEPERCALGRLLEGVHPVLARISARACPPLPVVVPLVMDIPTQEAERRLIAALRAALHQFGDAAQSSGHFEALALPYRLSQESLHGTAAFLQEHAQKGGLWLNVTSDNEVDLERDPVDRPPFSLDDETHARWAGSFQALLTEPFEVYQDIKLDSLLHALTTLWQEDEAANRSPRKLVLFSPHLRVLRYLAQQLTGAGYPTRLLAGNLALDELQVRAHDFASDPTVRLMLTTDRAAGCVELSCASALIHYDLPWEPERLAQRLRTIRRPGQAADRLLNLFLIGDEGFEAHVLLPLYRGLGLLEAPERAREGALSSADVRELLQLYLQPETTSEALAQAVDQRVTRGNARVEQRRAAVASARGLLPADTHLRESLRALRDRGAWPAADEQRLFLVQTLASRFPGIRLSGDPIGGEGQLDLTPAAVKALQARGVQKGPLVQALAVKAGKGAFPVTWSGALASHHAECELIQPGHALLDWALSLQEPELRGHGRAFCLLVRAEHLPPGRFCLGVWQLQVDGTREGRRLLPLAVRLDGDEALELPHERAVALYQALLTRGEEVPTPEEVDLPRLNRALDALEDHLRAAISAWTDGVAALEHVRLERRRTRALDAAQMRVAAVRAELERLRGLANEDASQTQAQRSMAQGRLKARAQILEALERLPEHQPVAGLGASLLALGLVDVVTG